MVVESLLKIVMLLGKQGLAFRGHRDDKVEWEVQDELEMGNQGNFIEMVRFRAETDQALQKLLKCNPKNATCTSKTIQNQLIECVGHQIRSNILQEVQEAGFYSVMADEVTDISNNERTAFNITEICFGW